MTRMANSTYQYSLKRDRSWLALILGSLSFLPLKNLRFRSDNFFGIRLIVLKRMRYTDCMFEGENWFEYLAEGQKDLVKEAYELIAREESAKNKFHDYSFAVFPMAKAYEGFLKKFFLETSLIDQKTYDGDRFRIGKALNPDLPQRFRGRWWLYGPMEERCGSEQVPRELWRAWRECRNRLFHFFPKHKHFINFLEAKQRVGQIKRAMEAALSCGIIDHRS